MKAKIILLVIFGNIIFNISKAQIVLDTVFPYTSLGPNYQLIRLEKSGYKWMITDRVNKAFTFLNMDHSLFRQFNYQADSATNLSYAIEYISEVLFDNDSTDIEFLLDYNQWPNTHRYIKIVDEAGNLLFYRDSALIKTGSFDEGFKNMLTAGITNTDSGAIMILRIGEVPSGLSVETYRLPGYYECSVCADEHLKLQMPMAVNPHTVNNDQNFLNAYPNPSIDATTIEYHLPLKFKTGKMTITDMNGKLVKTYNISQLSTKVIIEKGELRSGTYTCTIEAGGEMVSKKFIRIE